MKKTVSKDQALNLSGVWERRRCRTKTAVLFCAALAPGSISIQCATAGEVLVSEIYVLAHGMRRSASAKGAAPDRPRDAARNWTNVRMGERLTGLTITFAEGAGSLGGKVEAGEGKKLPSRLFVYLAPAEPDKSRGHSALLRVVSSRRWKLCC